MLMGIIENYSRSGRYLRNGDLLILSNKRPYIGGDVMVYDSITVGTDYTNIVKTDWVEVFEYDETKDPFTELELTNDTETIKQYTENGFMDIKINRDTAERVFAKCSDCGEFKFKRTMQEVVAEDGSLYLVCDDCHESDRYFHCRECNTTHPARMEHENSNVCEEAWISRDYRYCDDCGVAITENETYHYHGAGYCESCYDDRKIRSIHDYSYKPNPQFFGTGTRFFGVELEVDNGYDCEDTADSVNFMSEDRIYCKRDGSLCDGFEMVSHPCTLEFHKTSMGWKKIMETVRCNGFESEDTDTCGLHVHVNRDSLGESQKEQELTIAKLILLIERFYDDELLCFTRREMDKLEDWAKKPSSNIKANDNYTTIHDKLHYNVRGDRYTALNLNNSKTIEFRVFRGTLKFSTFIASIELCDALIKYAEKHTVRGCMTAKFANVIKQYASDNLTEYCKSQCIEVTTKGGK